MDFTRSGKNGLVISEMISPSILLRPEAKLRAWMFGVYPMRSIALRTFRLVSLTSLIAVYPALELDGSWTEPLRQLPSPCTQQPSSLQQKSFANRRHGRSAREKARQGQRSRYQWPERRRCP